MPQLKFTKPQLGPIIGHCVTDEKNGETTSSISIWVRFESSGKGLIGYKKKGDDEVFFQTFELIPTLGNVGIVRLINLEPDTRYQYKIGRLNNENQNWDNFENEMDESGNDIVRDFKTFAHNPEITRFIFGSCRHFGNIPPRQGDTAFKKIYENNMHNADFIVMGGDQVYVDYPTKLLGSYNPFKINKPPEDFEGYLEKYRIYYDQEGFKNTTASLPSYMIWDDHEVQNNWSKAVFLDDKEKKYKKESYLNGLKSYLGHQALFSPVVEDIGYNSELKDENIYDFRNGKPEEGIENVKYYYQMHHGDSAFFFMDVRGERTTISEGDMINEKQVEALESFLKEHPKKIKFIISPTPFFPDFVNKKAIGFAGPEDIWTGYAKQREVIINKIISIAKESDEEYILPVFLSGDVHIGLKAHLKCPQEDGSVITLHSIISSAFNWYIFGVQGLAARSNETLYNNWSEKKKERKKGDMFCVVDDINIKDKSSKKVIKGNNYTVIEAGNEGIKVTFQLAGNSRGEVEPIVISIEQLKI